MLEPLRLLNHGGLDAVAVDNDCDAAVAVVAQVLTDLVPATARLVDPSLRRSALLSDSMWTFTWTTAL